MEKEMLNEVYETLVEVMQEEKHSISEIKLINAVMKIFYVVNVHDDKIKELEEELKVMSMRKSFY